jgi:alanine-synthesizing transaminase
MDVQNDGPTYKGGDRRVDDGSRQRSNELIRYSNRLSWPVSANRFARLVAEKKGARVSILDLTNSNPTSVLPYPHAAIRADLNSPQDFSYCPDPFGSRQAREAISSYYLERGWNVPASRIALTASTSEAYSLLFKLLCDPGDEILVPVPSYPLFEYLAALENVWAVPYALRYDGSWFIDFDHVGKQISVRSRAIVLVNPNNPTGSFLKDHERRQLLEIANRKNIPVISDEVFMDFEFERKPQRVRTLVDQSGTLSFTLSGLSKAAGMPQMKLAWIVLSGPEKDQKQARERLELLLDTYLSVNTPVQMALPKLFETGTKIRAELQERCAHNLGLAAELLGGSPLHALHTEGGWSIIVQLPSMLDEEDWLYRLLQQENVLLQPGYFFDMPSGAYAVTSLITEPQAFREGIERLRAFAGQITRY